jgi:hypothetical protein
MTVSGGTRSTTRHMGTSLTIKLVMPMDASELAWETLLQWTPPTNKSRNQDRTRQKLDAD